MSTRKIHQKNQSKIAKPKSKPKHRRKSKASSFIVGLGLGAVAIISAAAGALLAVSMSTTPLRQAEMSPEEEAVFNQASTISYRNLRLPQLSRPVNILVIGVKVLTSDLDDPPEEKLGLGYHSLVNSFHGRSDSMLLLRFEPAKETVTVLSIPRDTKTNIRGYGIKKINDANYYGGPALTADTVSNLLGGVPIDRYLRVNIQGIEKLIDALGGVTVYVPKDMKYTDHSQRLYIDLKKGEQHLDGDKATQFLRFRYDELGDIGRVQRQQMLIRALIEQSLKPQNILKISDILSVISSHLDTNLTVEELVALSGFAGQAKRSKVQMLMLPGGFSGDGKTEISYWLPYENQIRSMMVQHFDLERGYNYQSREVEPSSLRVVIQDSTGDQEAVRTIIQFLQKEGYRRVYLGNNWSEPLQVTRIVAQKGDDLSAARLRRTLGIGEVLVESTGNIDSDITIQLGEDWQEQFRNEAQNFKYQKLSHN